MKARGVAWATVVGCLAICCAAHALDKHDSAELKTSDVRVEVRAGSTAPKLFRLIGSARSMWTNEAEETLPASVEINGATVPVTWRLKPALNKSDARNAVFVYESAEPHLRLSWQWEARADFGPLEHRITIENLSGQEVWLPMVDSLRLDWRAPAASDLRNFYVEKGADTPSAEGSHLETVAEGYNWTGKSSTYAHPVEGREAGDYSGGVCL
jgi:hypothetical protein